MEGSVQKKDGQWKKKYVDYFMDHDPLASWRGIIVVLDRLEYWGEKQEADKILAEAVTGEDR